MEQQDPYVFIVKNSISKELCKEIIMKFEEKDQPKYIGTILRGVDTSVKNDIKSDIDKNSDRWSNIHKCLSEELNKNIPEYMKYVNSNYKDDLISTTLNLEFVQYDDFFIQKYKKNEGFYKYHNDFWSDYNKKRYRLFTYIFYLNDITEGGETEFFQGTYKVKPEAGKLVMFPANWLYPHCGLMPISDDKYIITGWIFNNENNEYIQNLIEKFDINV